MSSTSGPKLVDVCPKKSVLACGPMDGEKLFDPWSSGRKGQECPKDPSVLKIVRRANSLRREKNATAIAKRYRECSEVLVFLRRRGRKTVQRVKNLEAAKYYGIERSTIFSTDPSVVSGDGCYRAQLKSDFPGST